MPDFSQHFILDTDASGEGLGAVLSQSREGQECVVAYASRSLSRTEKQYCATRRELLALVWASRHFRPYLYGRKFIVRTDHHALRWLHNFKEPAGQVARWLEQLAEFDYEVVHRQGKQHTNANLIMKWFIVKVSSTLMRMPCLVGCVSSVVGQQKKRMIQNPLF